MGIVQKNKNSFIPMVRGNIPMSEGKIPLFFQGTNVLGTVVRIKHRKKAAIYSFIDTHSWYREIN